jgi:hypothetical protein
VLEAGEEVLALADPLEERLLDLRVLDRDVGRAEQRARLAISMRGAEAAREKAKRSPRPLEVRDRGPALPHQLDERRVERVGGTDSVPQSDPFFLRLLLLYRRLSVRRPKLRDDLLVRRGRRHRGLGVGELGEKPPLHDGPISFPSTGSRRWSLRAARCSTV